MAKSGYNDAWVTSWDTLRFNWWEIEQSVSGNYTKIGWNLQLRSTSSGAISSTTAKSWNVTVNGNYYEGTNTVGIGNNATKTLASGETIIYHDANGNKEFSYSYNQYFGITFSGSKINTVSGSSKGTLDPILRLASITSAPDFTDKDSPIVYFSNPAGSAVTVKVCISWTGGDDIAYRNIVNPTDTSYTFNFTEAELNKLYAATTSGSVSRYVTFYVTTVINGTYYPTALQRLFTVTDCKPDLNPTVLDLGDASFKLTNNRDHLIRYFNYPQATFNAVAKKGASIVSKTVTCGSQTLTATDDYAQFNNVDSNSFIFTVIDNRGNEVSKTVTKDVWYEYNTLTCRTVVDKDLNSDDTANITLNIEGDYYQGSLGTVNNTLTVEYRYKSNTTDYPEEWTPIDESSVIIANGKYAAITTIENVDYRGTYTIQIRAKDRLYTWGVSAKDEIVKIIPVFDWGENDFNFNVPVTIQGKTIVDLIYPVGSIYMSVTYFDPATIFGGKWERLMDRFLLGSGATYVNAATGGEATHQLTVQEMPKHQHSVGYGNTGGYVTLNTGNTKGNYVLPWTADKGYSAADLVALEAGGGQAHNNMPPYLVVNMWKRIA